ncbi:MAG: hypothetical protein Q8L34_04880 [Candidatus Woesearchaeota archaeon]|nr:hypothetical protein [Candidatus Woesearchaeota archaeon]
MTKRKLDEKSNQELIDYVKKNHPGKRLTQFSREDYICYTLCGKRRVSSESKEINLREYLVQEGILIRKYSNDPKKIIDQIYDSAKEFFEQYPQYNHLPSAPKLREMGYRPFVERIIKYYPGGLNAFREFISQTLNRESGNTMRSRRFWQNPENLVKETMKFLKEHTKFKTIPGDSTLRKYGYTTLYAAINKYYPGKIVAFRQMINEKFGVEKVTYRRLREYWKKPNNVELEAIKFLEKYPEFDNLPILRIMVEKGYSSLTSAASRYYPGGIDGLRVKLAVIRGLAPPKPQGKRKINSISLLESLLEEEGEGIT